jgi:hypothetical protein
MQNDPSYRECLESAHPKHERYNTEQKIKAYNDLISSHPRLRALTAKARNELYTVPNYPTSSRFMEPYEQKFLSEAMQLIQDDVAKRPFHMHGESGAIGNKNGEISEFKHNPKRNIIISAEKGDKYILHSHPPFAEPFTSSASESDHMHAARRYLKHGNKAKEYVTNGKDVMHIHPASFRLVKLRPDPEVEEAIGKFPVAFTLPKPQDPPFPFANHEAPAAFKKDWAPPAGWKPPEDYPRESRRES